MNRNLFNSRNIAVEVELTNEKLLKDGQPYHYDASGCRWCNVCNEHWDGTADPDWIPCKHNNSL